VRGTGRVEREFVRSAWSWRRWLAEWGRLKCRQTPLAVASPVPHLRHGCLDRGLLARFSQSRAADLLTVHDGRVRAERQNAQVLTPDVEGLHDIADEVQITGQTVDIASRVNMEQLGRQQSGETGVVLLDEAANSLVLQSQKGVC